ncbi:hypothetical protein [Rhizobium tumorigenes]|uniref:hypothetical protein n=1 Tax=Rhizobium tumorigenes TaxID=2041385 RepID=UPI00241FF3FD|nr:hypothetical protein [Rhizobium tumorigenes]WFS01565.1 hypothetical protein PR016_02725 [Rhizobium tumorigenes]
MLSEAQIHAEAGIIIGIAMGRDKVKRRKAWRANEDPLGYVLGVEAIVSLVNRASFVTNHGFKNDLHPEYVTAENGTDPGYKSTLHPGSVPPEGGQ